MSIFVFFKFRVFVIVLFFPQNTQSMYWGTQAFTGCYKHL